MRRVPVVCSNPSLAIRERVLSEKEEHPLRRDSAADAMEQEDPAAAERMRYLAQCRRLGIDPELGTRSPLHYALEVIARMKP